MFQARWTWQPSENPEFTVHVLWRSGIPRASWLARWGVTSFQFVRYDVIEEDTVLHAYVPLYACTHIHTCGHKHTLYVRTKISEVILIFYKQKWGGVFVGLEVGLMEEALRLPSLNEGLWVLVVIPLPQWDVFQVMYNQGQKLISS